MLKTVGARRATATSLSKPGLGDHCGTECGGHNKAVYTGKSQCCAHGSKQGCVQGHSHCYDIGYTIVAIKINKEILLLRRTTSS